LELVNFDRCSSLAWAGAAIAAARVAITAAAVAERTSHRRLSVGILVTDAPF
jgi:hypothetical protein